MKIYYAPMQFKAMELQGCSFGCLGDVVDYRLLDRSLLLFFFFFWGCFDLTNSCMICLLKTYKQYITLQLHMKNT